VSYEIERNIPIPTKRPRSELTLALMKLEVGESILAQHKDHSKLVGAMGTAAYQREGTKFSYRTSDEGIRIWRIR